MPLDLHIKTGVSCTEIEGHCNPVSWRVRAQQQTPNSSHTSKASIVTNSLHLGHRHQEFVILGGQ